MDLFSRTLTIRKSKTAAGERTIPLTGVACSALARLRTRAESFGPVDPAHYVFAAFVPKFTFSGKKVVDYNVTGFDPTKHVNSWRSAWRTLTKKAGLPGFRFHDLRHCAITSLAESGAADSTIMAIAGHVSRKMLERYSHVRMEAKRTAMEALATSTRMAGYDTNHDTNALPVNARPSLNYWTLLVDLVGIEPTTSSMPWKRAPSCATGPHWRVILIVFYRTNFVKPVPASYSLQLRKAVWHPG